MVFLISSPHSHLFGNSTFTTSSASILARQFPLCPPIFLPPSDLSSGVSFFILYSSFELGKDEFLEFKPSLSLSSAFSISKILFFSSSFLL
jgi:hypothetical protein